MVNFSEAIWNMDKWAVEDFEVQEEFHEILLEQKTSEKEKIEEIEDFLEILVWNWIRLESYLYDDEEVDDEVDDGEDRRCPDYSNHELATYIVKHCV